MKNYFKLKHNNVVFIIMFTLRNCLYAPHQWSIIDKSIKYYKSLECNKYLQPIHNHIYMNHHNWTIHYTNNFIKNNEFYLKPSQHNELYIYAIRGLLNNLYINDFFWILL